MPKASATPEPGKIKILVICGPTATGKTKLAEHLAMLYDGELVSADSRQVYRGMTLTTGKDPVSVPIWLYDVADPDEEFSVSHWVRLARTAISDIRKRGKLPIVVGGTGLYIRALINPPETVDIPPDKSLRAELTSLSVRELQGMVNRGNMNDSDWNNPRRLIRKIEISKAQKTSTKPMPQYHACIIGLMAPLPALDARIDEKMQARKRAGMDREAETLLSRYDHTLPSMSAIGVNEHAYARRQMTWFRKQEGVEWFDITDVRTVRDIEKRVGEWYTS